MYVYHAATWFSFSACRRDALGFLLESEISGCGDYMIKGSIIHRLSTPTWNYGRRHNDITSHFSPGWFSVRDGYALLLLLLPPLTVVVVVRSVAAASIASSSSRCHSRANTGPTPCALVGNWLMAGQINVSSRCSTVVLSWRVYYDRHRTSATDVRNRWALLPVSQ